jgi:hypothetical protein
MIEFGSAEVLFLRLGDDFALVFFFSTFFDLLSCWLSPTIVLLAGLRPSEVDIEFSSGL